MVDFIDLRLLESLNSDFAKRLYLTRCIYFYFKKLNVGFSTAPKQEMAKQLMDNTKLSNKEIAKFCDMSVRTVYNIKKRRKLEK